MYNDYSKAQETSIFILCWLAMWLLFTTIGWFCTPGIDFREVAGHPGTVITTLIFGWIPGAFILSD